MELSTERCNPEISRVSPLTRKEILEYLKKVPGWTVVENRLQRTYEQEDFDGCVSFINELNDLCKREGHFPDLKIEKESILTISWYTYSSGGITKNDFIMAAKINHSERFNSK
ncbi:4a-hydroxytetrahydrobiopterin dehydratase [Methanomicrobium antiquum]|uniref:4a-hydroxytetrahydrobiopterin dehydratase n=1 Tax=Methanomicrobium antiquum TaxID=487686 RepID=A0AAF0JTX1_9EURY|nr:4a-hydroxytetrahydrobiopterin dehydratase [Methanomicrobium antiquum]MDD3977072.1 4a-hydroxytetrahydrobiopterin dehydratase [Methanomicrobium sp.]WFN36898.1 4a-hydroxytetrahydrobiopterin dehydratase [Methanomicrobium antiquum]